MLVRARFLFYWIATPAWIATPGPVQPPRAPRSGFGDLSGSFMPMWSFECSWSQRLSHSSCLGETAVGTARFPELRIANFCYPFTAGHPSPSHTFLTEVGSGCRLLHSETCV
ncbi:hypothetical protein F5B19DRAFT_479121, partial [Rostrohypoxylon terebratum]